MELNETGIVFPGQGSQEEGMREHVERDRPDLLEAVDAVMGEDPFARVGEGTRFDQPAIFCAGLAAYERLGRPVPAFFAGHSLGELTALVAARVLDEEDGLRLVALRGRLSDEAAGRSKGGMLVLRTGRDVACSVAERAGLSVANDNAPEQVVLSGPDAALRAGEQEAELSGLRAKRLPVAGAFHSPAMRPAVSGFREALGETPLHKGTAPVFSCVTRAPFDDVPYRLAQALVSQVRWRETLLALRAAGARRFIEPGPGKTLAGLVRRCLPDAEMVAPEELEAARA